jgi:hypothetical protein
MAEIANFTILAKHHGHYRTVKDWACVNRVGQPIPWYTYPLIEYLDNIDLSGAKVLEYGSGNSSLYYLRRGSIVTSIEDNEEWYKRISIQSERFSYFLCKNKEEYVERPEIRDADIIVIDGIFRKECADYLKRQMEIGIALPKIVIFDNSDWYPNTISGLDEKLGWHRVDFCGFGPINGYTWVSSIYLSPDKKLPRIKRHISPIGGIIDNADA